MLIPHVEPVLFGSYFEMWLLHHFAPGCQNYSYKNIYVNKNKSHIYQFIGRAF